MLNILLSLIGPVLLSCTPDPVDNGLAPALRLTVSDVQVDKVVLKLETLNSSSTYVLVQGAEQSAPSHEDIAKKGVQTTESSLTIDKLEAEKNYAAYAYVSDKAGKKSAVQSVKFRTAQGVSFLYDWEASRTELPSYDNLALCYGGSAHRSPFKWDKDRFASHVTYTDAEGREKWLFDAFLAIEFVMTQTNMSINLGQGRPSADKDTWQKLIDYWFEPGYGFDALDQAVRDAKGRIGSPKTTRKVVMVMPDPIPYKEFANQSSSTTYWGSLDGKVLDFAKGEDRIAAMKWYVDQVRARWNAAGYKNLELAGFYVVSEDLAVPGHGWSAELKHWEDVYPEISKYIHSANESITWIPYYKAGAYTLWDEFQIDYAMMQPNMFWGNHPEYNYTEFEKMVTSNGMSMELEMDDDILEGSSTPGTYRARYREYMSQCKKIGLYGKRELSYYMGGNTFYKLAHSSNPEDVKMYRELCEFIIGHANSR